MAMFTPSKMCFVHILVPEDQLMDLFEKLVKTGCFQIVHKDKLPDYRHSFSTYDTKALADRLNGLKERIETLQQILGVRSERIEGEVRINPPQVVEEVEEEISRIEAEVFPVIDRIKELEERSKALDELSEKILPLEREGIEPQELRNLTSLHLICGFSSREGFSRLRAGLSRIPHVILSHELPFRDMTYVYIFIPSGQKEALKTALRTAPFTEDRFLERVSGTLGQITEKIETDLWEAREEKVSLLSQLRNLKQTYGRTLSMLKRLITVNIFVTEALANVGRTGREFLISGWVPYNSIKKIKRVVESFDRSLLEVSPPIPPLEEKKNPELVPPTKFEHPGFLKPFEGLVTIYGYPSYSELDPTLIVTLSFLVMFGIMFADVGHGAVLLILGLLMLLSRIRGLRNFSIGTMGCGVSATLFGFLFGSFFGREDVIPALWFRPFENIMSFLKMSVGFGVGVLSLGLLLNVIQGFRRKSWTEAVFGKNGLAGIALYWTVIIAAIYLLKGGVLTLGAKCAIGIILGMSVLLIAFGNHLYLRLKNRYSEEGLVESAFGVVELALSILCNTLSFIRVAAFNISHAGLCFAIYAVAEQLGQFMPGKGASLSVIIPGHLMIIGLEGVIVFIQCLRLEYYEFFSKFFSGQGIKFEPLRIS